MSGFVLPLSAKILLFLRAAPSAGATSNTHYGTAISSKSFRLFSKLLATYRNVRSMPCLFLLIYSTDEEGTICLHQGTLRCHEQARRLVAQFQGRFLV